MNIRLRQVCYLSATAVQFFFLKGQIRWKKLQHNKRQKIYTVVTNKSYDL